MPRFKVYQLNAYDDSLHGIRLWNITEPVEMCHYHHVGTILAAGVDHAFAKMQRIDNNTFPDFTGDQSRARSMSVSDLLEWDGHYWAVANVGFTAMRLSDEGKTIAPKETEANNATVQ